MNEFLIKSRKSYVCTVIIISEKYHFSKEDAEAFLETIKEAKSEDLATKADILRSETKISLIDKQTNEIQKEINEIKKDIRLLDVNIEFEKNQLVIWVFGIMFAMSGLIIGVLKIS